MQKVPNGDIENAQCDQYKVDLLEEEVKGGLRGSPIFYERLNIKLMYLSIKYSVTIADLRNNNNLHP